MNHSYDAIVTAWSIECCSFSQRSMLGGGVALRWFWSWCYCCTQQSLLQFRSQASLTLYRVIDWLIWRIAWPHYYGGMKFMVWRLTLQQLDRSTKLLKDVTVTEMRRMFAWARTLPESELKPVALEEFIPTSLRRTDIDFKPLLKTLLRHDRDCLLCVVYKST